MATPRRPAAMPSTTSMASVMAVKDFEVRCRSPLCDVHQDKKYGPFVYEFGEDAGKVVLLDGEEHFVRKVYKKFLDPYGFSQKPPKIKEVCHNCGQEDCVPGLKCPANISRWLGKKIRNS